MQNTTDVFIDHINKDNIPDIVIANDKWVSLLLGNAMGIYEDLNGISMPLFNNIAVGDIDGDNRSEVLISNVESTSENIIRSLETPNIRLKNSYLAEKLPTHHGIGDFDKDGNLDMAVVYQGLDSILIKYGLGNGQFSEGNFLSVGKAPAYIAIGDINNDKYPDAIVYNSDSSELSILVNDKKGKFLPQLKQTKLPPYIMNMELKDMDNNGFLDVILTQQARTHIYLGDGKGNFTFKSTLLFQHPYYNVYWGDFNNDKKLDMITTTDGIYFGNGDGTFKPVVKVQNIVNGNLIVLDFDKDSNLDLVFVKENSKQVELLLGNGDGTFNNVSKTNTSLNIYGGTTSDFNGDNIADLCFMTYDNALLVLIGKSDNTFQELVLTNIETRTPDSYFKSSIISVGDINNDYKQDLVFSGVNYSSVYLNILINTSSIITDIANIQPNEGIQQIFPNPSTGSFVVNCEQSGAVEIIDARGVKVWNGMKEEKTLNINAPLKNGIYLVKIQDFLSKISVQH